MTRASVSSAARTSAGAWPSCSTSARAASGASAPRARPRWIASIASAASWLVKAFVEATPISGPVRV